MSDSKKGILLEEVGNNGEIIKIRFPKQITPRNSSVYIATAFDKCFKNGYHRIIVDMEHIPHTTNSFIATLIEATAKVRRRDGDVKIINLSEEAEQTMAAFNAYTFLSIELNFQD